MYKKQLRDWEIEGFEDFELLDWKERRWLVDNGMIGDYWAGLWESRTTADRIDSEWDG